MILDEIPHLLYGGDYNPEQWPEDVWLEDARLMREAGVNLVSLAVFAWAQLEPRPGEYEFEWLDRAVEVLTDQGVRVNLATATASPPPWLARRHPESLPEDAAGVRLWPGSRQHYCPSSEAYRRAAARLVGLIAERYAGHPGVVMWHVNNEYGCHVAHCYCDASARAFRAWLQRRYDSIQALNEAWGTAFWSQRYDDWEEINPPRATPTWGNPSQQLDFHRFSSDALLELFDMERGILEREAPSIPVTTNFMSFFKPVDYWKWADRLDVVANDSYPDPADPLAHVGGAMASDLMRSLSRGRAWVLMEQTPSRVSWRPHNLLKAPGQMRLWSYQCVARGAEGIMFFQWRAARAGAETFHGAMVGHAGPGSRTHREVKELGAELARLDVLLGSRTEASVGVLFDWDSWWALELPAKPSARVRMLERVQDFYRPLFDANIGVDFVAPWTDLSRYRVLIAPNLYLLGPGVAENLERYVEAGGVLVMSFFSGIVDEHDHVLLGGYPAPLRGVLGLEVEDFAPHGPGDPSSIIGSDGGVFGCDLWSDLIRLRGAEVVAAYGDGRRRGDPAVTRNAHGRGAAYYLGTRADDAYTGLLLRRACDETGVRPALSAPRGVEAVVRERDGRRWLFVLNHGDGRVEVGVPEGRELLAGTAVDGSIQLDPYDLAIIETS